MRTSSPGTRLQQAQQYQQQGWSVIPLRPGSKRPAVAWRTYQKRRATADELNRWFCRGENNIAIITGSASHLFTLDFDNPALMHRFIRQHPDLARTWTVKTRRGFHLYYTADQLPPACQVPGLDIQSEGRYVVAPPSAVAGHTYETIVNSPPKKLSAVDLAAITAFIDGFRTLDTHFYRQAESGLYHHTPEGMVAYYDTLRQEMSRNDALFRAALKARDSGWHQTQTVLALVEPHVSAAPPAGHAPETPEQRRREAVATIASAYNRAPQGNHSPASRLSGSLREYLLQRSDGTAILRVLEGMYLAGWQPGQPFTEADAMRLLLPFGIGRYSVRKALQSASPLTTPANADVNNDYEKENRGDNQWFFVRVTKPDSRHIHYRLPTPDTLCQRFNITPTPGDPIHAADLHTAKSYRQALQRGFIKRRPGEHSVRWMGLRLGLSERTIQRYHREMPVNVRPVYTTTPIFRSNLDILPPQEDAIRYNIPEYGRFIEDTGGKRYPAYREVADTLLQSGKQVLYRFQRPNYYWYGSDPPATAPPVQPHSGPQRSTTSYLPQTPPERARIARFSPAQPEPTVTPLPVIARPAPEPAPPRSKRYFRRPLPDSRCEKLAQRVYNMLQSLATYKQVMSRANTRRLVDTYGVEAVEWALGKLRWLAERDKVRNPSGLLVTMARQQWRELNNATGPGTPAPVFRGEPARRKRPRRTTDPVTRSEVWLVERIAAAYEEGDTGAVETWHARLETVIRKRSVRRLRWRLRFAQQHESGDEIAFWQIILHWREGKLEEDLLTLLDLTREEMPF